MRGGRKTSGSLAAQRNKQQVASAPLAAGCPCTITINIVAKSKQIKIFTHYNNSNAFRLFWRDNVFLRGVHLELDYCAPWHAQAFLPDRYQRRRSWRRTVTIATMLLLCCLHLRRVKCNKRNIYSLEGSLRYKYKLHIATVKINIE